MANDYSDFKYFNYTPSLVAAIIFTVLFLVTSFTHLFQLIFRRTWFFIPLVIGGLCEFVGYVGRILASRQTPNWTLGPYIVQSLTLLIAPALFAASIYMMLGKIIQATDGEHHSLVPKKWLTKIFVTCDVLSFLVLSAGGGMLASSGDGSNIKLGEHLILGGLFIQIVAFGVFVIVSILFHKRMSSYPTIISARPELPWQKHLFVLYLASALIMIRSIVRVIEYIQGNNGYILSHEWFLYVFDAALMFLVLAIFNVFHPSDLSRRKSTAFDRETSLEQLQTDNVVQVPKRG